MKRVELREFRARYAATIEDLAKSNEPVIIERDGRAIGAFVPIELYQHFLAWWDYQRFRERELADADRDRAAYLAMKDKLLQIHRGEFVCFREGQLVGIDSDEQALLKRVYKQFGYGPVFVHRIADTEPGYRIRSPRVVR